MFELCGPQIFEQQIIHRAGRLKYGTMADARQLLILSERHQASNQRDMRGWNILVVAAPDQKSLAAFPPEVVASMRQDLDAGRRLELESTSGAIVRRGRALGVATPFHETAYACLKPYRDGAPSA